MTVQDSSPSAFLETPEGEISFFRSIMRARPVGIHRHFHVLTIRNAIQRDTGHLITTQDIWTKLKSCYNLDALEGLEADGYEAGETRNSTPASIPSPSPSQNLYNHPYFRQEYALPQNLSYENLIAPRRLRTSASPPSSPASSPVHHPVTRISRSERRSKGKLNMAGLIGGDSDSSALTQESGDEGTPRDDVVSGTDAGTDYGEDEDAEMRDPSPAPSATSKPTRGKGSKPGKRGGSGRGRGGGTTGASNRASWKKKKK